MNLPNLLIARSRRQLRARQNRRLLLEQFECRRVLAGIWDGGGAANSWHDPLNWDDDQLPGATTDVTIGAAFAGETITSAADVTVRSVTSEAALSITGGTFSVSADSDFNGAVAIGAATLLLSGAQNTTIDGALTTAAGSTIRIDSPVDSATVALTVANGFTNNGLIELTGVDNGIATLAVTNGTLTNAASGTLRVAAGGGGGIRGLDAQLNNQGLLEVAHPIDINRAEADHINSGTINVSAGTVQFTQSGASPSFTNSPTGVINVTNTGILVFNQSPSATFTNNGALNVAAGRTLNVLGGTVTNISGGTLTGGTYNIAGTLRLPAGTNITANAANIVLDGALSAIVATPNTNALANLAVNTGSLTLRGGRLLTTSGSLLNTTTGTLTVVGTSVLDPTGLLDNDGVLAGTGTVTSDVQSEGQVSPGVGNTGTLGVGGNFTQTATGDLNIELGGIAAGSFDQLNTSGTVTLGGDLNVSLVGPFVPAPGNSFIILDNEGAGAISGTFNGLPEGATITVGGVDLQISYVGGTGNDVVLTAQAEGNTAPVAVNDAFSTNENTPLLVAAPGVLGNDTDADGDPLTAEQVSSTANGTLVLNTDGSFTYTPNTGFTGTDTFTYNATDGTLDSNVATVSITVSAAGNTAPVAVNDAFSTGEDTPLIVAPPGVLGNDTDADGDTLTAVLVTDVTSGTLVLNADGSFTYTPDLNFSGADSFTYQANDGTANSNIATVTLTVNAVNDAPVAVNDSFSTPQNTPLVIGAPGVLGNDTDPDGDTLTAELVTDASNGTLVLNANGSFTYTPNTGFTGTDTFTYNATDGALDSNVATVTLTVTAVNTAPVAVDDAFSTGEDTPLIVAAPGVLGNDTDAEGNTLTAVLVTGPASGTLVLNADGSFTYTPDSNFNGIDSFTYRANDGSLNSNVATVSLTVSAVNDAPVAVNNSFSTEVNTPLIVAPPGVLGNDTDPDGDALTASLVTGPANGTLVFSADGSFTYTPNLDFTGSDSFTYTASDGTLTSNVATVSITVEEEDVEIPDFDISDENSAAIVDDPRTGGTALLVVGTDERDVIVITPRHGKRNQVTVRRNGEVIGHFRESDFARIAVFTLGGDDKVIINSRVDVRAELHGGDDEDQLFGSRRGDLIFGEGGDDKLFGLRGNDRLFGGAGDDDLFGGQGNDMLFGEDGRDDLFGQSGHDVLVGGADQDELFGGSGRDLLIGGSGIDRLFGQGDEDILITEKTSFDEDEEALLAIMAEWRSGRSRRVRIQNLRDGTGSANAANDAFFLEAGVTIEEDSSDDHVFGFNRKQDFRV